MENCLKRSSERCAGVVACCCCVWLQAFSSWQQIHYRVATVFPCCLYLCTRENFPRIYWLVLQQRFVVIGDDCLRHDDFFSSLAGLGRWHAVEPLPDHDFPCHGHLGMSAFWNLFCRQWGDRRIWVLVVGYLSKKKGSIDMRLSDIWNDISRRKWWLNT